MSIPSSEKINALDELLLQLGIYPEDLRIKAITGSSKGGQKQNSTKNCIYIKHIPSDIEIKCHKSRAKTANLFFAKRELLERIQALFGQKTTRSEKGSKLKKQKKRRKRRSLKDT